MFYREYMSPVRRYMTIDEPASQGFSRGESIVIVAPYQSKPWSWCRAEDIKRRNAILALSSALLEYRKGEVLGWDALVLP